MVILYVTMIGGCSLFLLVTVISDVIVAFSILIQVEASAGTAFYNINTELVYLCIQAGLTVLYTILVAHRLLRMRKIAQAVAHLDTDIYNTIIIMIVESAVPYSIFTVVFILSFALHYDALCTICFLSCSQLQVCNNTQIANVSDVTLCLGHCTIVHHHSRCNRASSYT